MKNVFLGFVVFLVLQVSVDAADKIRIGFPEFNSSTFTLPMAHLKGFFHDEGLQAELIRIRSAVALPALTSGEIDCHTVVAPAVTAALREAQREMGGR
jgi:ABC-type nitrate/sulfonate/bicarbonate transport system substrate-binding protein